MQCEDFLAGRCRSCRWLDRPYSDQLNDKQNNSAQKLAAFTSLRWLPIQASPVLAFRNKAKMAVSGHWRDPVLGIVDARDQAVDLTACPLYPSAFQPVFAYLKAWITECQLMPYSISQRTGELKFVLVSYSESAQTWMIRWVLRSKNSIPILRQHLPNLLAQLPEGSVISANIQPIDMAVLEGEEEILLSTTSHICHLLNEIPLYCRPQSFFQTNHVVASQLYRQAQAWVLPLAPRKVWDLFCGVGGFALHLAQVLPKTDIIGIEVSASAIASAQFSAEVLSCSDRTEFRALTAQDFSQDSSAQADHPDGVIVNPPRRGLGQALCQFLNTAEGVQWLIYSSCHVDSLTVDLQALSHFTPVTAQVFDMFPHTEHVEVLVLLLRHPENFLSFSDHLV